MNFKNLNKKIPSLFTLLLFSVLSCQQPLNLLDVLDGPEGLPLDLTPDSSQIVISSTLEFQAEGGVPPYLFTIESGGGSINEETGVFTAPADAGSSVITVLDSAGLIDSSTVTIIAGSLSSALAISPSAISLNVNGSVTFSSTGGTSPYTYSLVTGSGTINATTGAYTAPALAGTDTIRVTDSVGATSDAVVSISDSSALAIYPSTLTLNANGTITFVATGGTSPYTFSIFSGSGTVNATTGLYTAPAAAGSDTVRVTDNVGATKDAVITISDLTTNVDYEVTAVTDTSGSHQGGDPVTGTFTLTNVGSADSTKTVEWSIYASLGDSTYDGNDELIDTGTAAALTAGNSSVVNFTDIWPTTAGTYYLIVKTNSTDDISNTINNTAVSGGIVISDPPVADVDYYVNSPPAGGTTILTESSIADTFTIHNQGSEDGSQPVNWTVYISTDTNLDIGTDSVIDSGSISALGADTISGPINFSGAWPKTANTYYLLFNLITGEDNNTLNDLTPSTAAYTVNEPDIDYSINAISSSGNVLGGSHINETFSVINTGSNDGAQKIYWTAYLLSDTTFGNTDDIPVDTGNIGALAGGNTISADIVIDSGSWPSVSSSTDYYLFVDVSASDETSLLINNYDYNTVTVDPPDIDYVVTTVTNTGTPTDTDNLAITESFEIQNTGADDGSANILWYAYYSSDTILDGTDTEISNGQIDIDEFNLGTTTGGSISGTWPGASGTYYLIVKVSAADETDSTNNYTPSGSFTISSTGNVDYIVSSVSSDYKTVTTGSPLSESFTITNAGTAGTNDISWQAYASGDTVWDGSDISLGSGTLSALGTGATSSDISLSSIDWPATPGSYYLVITVSTTDSGEIDTNNEGYSGLFTVNDPPDYEIFSTSFPIETLGAELVNETDLSMIGAHTFTIKEMNTASGMQTITWNAYISTDAVLDGLDTNIDSGTIPALAAGATSAAQTVTGSIPATYGYYYLLLQISAGDDEIPGNNGYVSPVLYVWQETGNTESGTTGITYLNDAEDYALLLNSGDSVTITGTTNNISEDDLFKVTTGSDVGTLQATLDWTASGLNDALDLYMYESDGTLNGVNSATTATSTESCSWTVAADQVYYINPYTVINNKSGYDYTLVITAGP